MYKNGNTQQTHVDGVKMYSKSIDKYKVSISECQMTSVVKVKIERVVTNEKL